MSCSLFWILNKKLMEPWGGFKCPAASWSSILMSGSAISLYYAHMSIHQKLWPHANMLCKCYNTPVLLVNKELLVGLLTTFEEKQRRKKSTSLFRVKRCTGTCFTFHLIWLLDFFFLLQLTDSCSVVSYQWIEGWKYCMQIKLLFL